MLNNLLFTLDLAIIIEKSLFNVYSLTVLNAFRGGLVPQDEPARVLLEKIKAAAIQNAFDFDDDHLYSFYMNPTRWSGEGYGSPYGEIPPFADKVKLGELDLYKGRIFNYLFDFGDSWQFSIRVENFDPLQPEPVLPVVVDAKGENPEQYPDWDEDEEDEQ